MVQPTTAAARRPDPRVERSRQAILDATRELLADGDVGSLTVEAVASRSGVAKTTIYRRWRDKWELALDAVMIDMIPRFEKPVDRGQIQSGCEIDDSHDLAFSRACIRRSTSSRLVW